MFYNIHRKQSSFFSFLGQSKHRGSMRYRMGFTRITGRWMHELFLSFVGLKIRWWGAISGLMGCHHVPWWPHFHRSTDGFVGWEHSSLFNMQRGWLILKAVGFARSSSHCPFMRPPYFWYTYLSGRVFPHRTDRSCFAYLFFTHARFCFFLPKK